MSYDNDFLIRLDLICREGGNSDPDCRKKMASYLSWEHLWDDTEQLYKRFKSEIFDEDAQPGIPHKQMIFEMNRYGRGNYYFSQSPKMGVLLNQPVLVTRDSDRQKLDEQFFPYFFAYRLSKSNDVESFLTFHFTQTFNYNSIQFKGFILEILPKFDFLQNLIPSVTHYLDYILKRKRPRPTKPKTTDPTFDEFFQDFEVSLVRKLFECKLSDERNRYKNVSKIGRALDELNKMPSRAGQVLARIIIQEFSHQRLGKDSVIAALRPVNRKSVIGFQPVFKELEVALKR